MRLFQRAGHTFTVPEIIATDTMLDVEDVVGYIQTLHQYGYLQSSSQYDDYMDHGWITYRLVRDTGPKAPQLRMDGRLFDRNTSSFAERTHGSMDSGKDGHLTDRSFKDRQVIGAAAMWLFARHAGVETKLTHSMEASRWATLSPRISAQQIDATQENTVIRMYMEMLRHSGPNEPDSYNIMTSRQEFGYLVSEKTTYAAFLMFDSEPVGLYALRGNFLAELSIIPMWIAATEQILAEFIRFAPNTVIGNFDNKVYARIPYQKLNLFEGAGWDRAPETSTHTPAFTSKNDMLSDPLYQRDHHLTFMIKG